MNHVVRLQRTRAVAYSGCFKIAKRNTVSRSSFAKETASTGCATGSVTSTTSSLISSTGNSFSRVFFTNLSSLVVRISSCLAFSFRTPSYSTSVSLLSSRIAWFFSCSEAVLLSARLPSIIFCTSSRVWSTVYSDVVSSSVTAWISWSVCPSTNSRPISTNTALCQCLPPLAWAMSWSFVRLLSGSFASAKLSVRSVGSAWGPRALNISSGLIDMTISQR